MISCLLFSTKIKDSIFTRFNLADTDPLTHAWIGPNPNL